MQATITLPIELLNDNVGRSAHWSRAAKRKRQYRAIISVLHPRRKPFDHPVKLVITRVLGPRQKLCDKDSIGRGSAKELVDALVASGFLHDDGPQWVTSVEYRQDAGDRLAGPGVIVEFLPG